MWLRILLAALFAAASLATGSGVSAMVVTPCRAMLNAVQAAGGDERWIRQCVARERAELDRVRNCRRWLEICKQNSDGPGPFRHTF